MARNSKYIGWLATVFLVACSTVPSSRVPTAASQNIVSLDVHHHFNHLAGNMLRKPRDPIKDFAAYQQTNLVQHSFLIPDAFMYPFAWDSSITKAVKDEDNKTVNGFAQNHPDTHGFCSINLLWPDALTVTKECLALKNMIGVKIHFMRSELRAMDDINLPAFRAVIELVAKKHGFLLVHFGGNPFAQKEGRPEYTQNLLKIAAEYPEANFIIAHSGYQTWIGVSGLTIIGNYFRDHPEVKRNIYTDTSTVLNNVAGKTATERMPDYIPHRADPPLPTLEEIQNAWKQNPDVVEAWRAFGIDYVLFGSDAPFYDLETEINTILWNPLLSAEEKNKILQENGKRVLALLR